MLHLSWWLLYLVTDTLPCLCDLFRWFMILVLGSNHRTSKWSRSLKGHDSVTLMESPWPQILLIKVIYEMFVGYEWSIIKAECLSGPLEWQLGKHDQLAASYVCYKLSAMTCIEVHVAPWVAFALGSGYITSWVFLLSVLHVWLVLA